jgi:phage FluMu gp28-like protein
MHCLSFGRQLADSAHALVISLESILLPYQRQWLADRAAVKVYEKSRRIGITWAESADAALDAGTTNGADWWYIGYNKEMALEFVESAAEWARRFNQDAHRVEEIMVADENRDILAYRIRFNSGWKIVALSSRPSNLRGKQGVAVIDEAAFHDELPELLKAALALTIWGGRVHIISTHNGATNPFKQLIIDIRAGRRPYSLHRTTLDDALAQGLHRAICRDGQVLWTASGETAWRAELMAEYGSDAEEELLCVPNTSSGVFIPSALIEARMSDDIPVLRWHCRSGALERGNAALVNDANDWIAAELEPALVRLDPQLMSCFGEDFGRSGDLTVIWPLQLAPNLIRRTPFLVELRDVPFKQQAQVLFHIVDRLPRFIGGAMDARGNGQYLAEEAALRYGARIEQVLLSVEWYRENMPRYKAAFEDGKLELPRNADILADHRLLRMQQGVARLAERRIRGGDGNQRHGDSAIAGALAYYASYSNQHEYAYKAVSSRSSRLNPGSDSDERTPTASSTWGASRARFRPGSW